MRGVKQHSQLAVKQDAGKISAKQEGAWDCAFLFFYKM